MSTLTTLIRISGSSHNVGNLWSDEVVEWTVVERESDMERENTRQTKERERGREREREREREGLPEMKFT